MQFNFINHSSSRISFMNAIKYGYPFCSFITNQNGLSKIIFFCYIGIIRPLDITIFPSF